MKYLLDTDSVSYALRGQGHVAEHILQQTPSALGVSSITVAVLRFGAHRRGSRKLTRLIDTFLGSVQVCPFDEAAANAYGKLAADLVGRGAIIGQADTMIAAHTLSLGLILVTNNQAHFQRVRGLRLENWL